MQNEVIDNKGEKMKEPQTCTGTNKILGISGSPIKNGNIEQAINLIMQNSTHEGKLVRLSNMKINPCIGCLKCDSTNQCIQKDDMSPFLHEIRDAKAIIIGAFPTFKSINALSKTFIERLYPLKHRYMLTRGKIGIGVVSGFRDSEKVEDYLRSVFDWFQMEYLGSLRIPGNAPCLSCAVEEDCPYSNVRIMYGPDKGRSPEMFHNIQRETGVLEEAELLGVRLDKRLQEIS
ncbi:MAG: flavodoxin family protein [Desulfitobacterium hafniense]|nr:flavodoxin family protein [Desulfitobacterium hafniense]